MEPQKRAIYVLTVEVGGSFLWSLFSFEGAEETSSESLLLSKLFNIYVW